jgi:hypothetical protein
MEPLLEESALARPDSRRRLTREVQHIKDIVGL